jgi:hypothetical protein
VLGQPHRRRDLYVAAGVVEPRPVGSGRGERDAQDTRYNTTTSS